MSNGSGAWRRDPEQDPVPPLRRDDGPTSSATPTRSGSHIIRPMPAGDDGGSFEDLARRSVLSRARDDSRFEGPELLDAGTSHRTLSLRTLLVLAVTMLVLGIVGGSLWVNVFRTVGIDGETTVKPSSGTPETLLSPQEVVLGYLQALAGGDAEKALAFGPSLSKEESTVLVEQSGYDAMPPASRPSNIRVLTEDALATEIRVEYTLSGEPVSTTMRVVRQDDDSYLLERTTVTIQLQVVGSENLPVQLNNVTVEPQLLLAVFPGTYRPSTGLPLVAFLDAEPIVIPSLAYPDTEVFPINPELAPAGRAGFQKAARTSLDRCLASGELAPTGCPNAIRAPKQVVPGSVRWDLQNPDSVWESFNPTLSPTDQTMAVATLSMQLRVTMDYSDGLSSGNNDINLNVAVSATMVGDDPTSLSVAWGG